MTKSNAGRPSPDMLVGNIQGAMFSTDPADNGRIDGQGAFVAYLCGGCDDVHLVYQFGDCPFQWNMRLTTEQAEKLADLLLNPRIHKPGA